MKRWMAVAVVGVLVAGGAEAQSWLKKDTAPKKTKGWISDFEAAKKESEANKQPIFAFFTGSDWCGWCMKLRGEVLDTQAFNEFAAANLVLFEADFPRGKRISDKTKKQNEKLASTYGVRGFPSVFMLDATGQAFGQTGYREGGAQAYIAHLKGLLEQAGFKPVDPSASVKPLSLYEKMKAERAANAVQPPTK